MQFPNALRSVENIINAFYTFLDRLRDSAGRYGSLMANIASSAIKSLADEAVKAWSSLVKWADEALKAAIKTLAKTNKAIVVSIKIFISDSRRLVGQAYTMASNLMARLAYEAGKAWSSLVNWADEALKAIARTLAIIIEKMQRSIRVAHKTMIGCCQRIKSEASSLWALYQSSYNEQNDIDEQLDRLIAESENISSNFHGANRLGSGLPDLSVSSPAITREEVMRELMKSNMLGEKITKASIETLTLKEPSPIISPVQETMITPPIQEVKAQEAVTREDVMRELMKSNMLGEKIMKANAEPQKEASPGTSPIQETMITPPIQEIKTQEAVTREDVMRELMKSNMLGEKIMKANAEPQNETSPGTSPIQETMITPPIQEAKAQEAITREDVMRELMKSNMLGEKIMKNVPLQPSVVEESSPIPDDDPFKEEENPLQAFDPFEENAAESPEPIKMEGEDLLTSLEKEAEKVEAEDMGLDIMRDMKDKAITCEELESELKDVLAVFRKARTVKRKVKIEKRDAY